LQAYDALKVSATRGSYGAKIFRLESPGGTLEKPAAVPAPGPAPQPKLAELNYGQGNSYDQEEYGSAIQAF
jgi:hypothetical protein